MSHGPTAHPGDDTLVILLLSEGGKKCLEPSLAGNGFASQAAEAKRLDNLDCASSNYD